MGLVNETLELIDDWRSLELQEAFASATGCVHDSLMSELQDLARLIQHHWTQHVEPIQGQQSHTGDVLLVLMDWDNSSMRYVLKEFTLIKQLRVTVQNQLVAEGNWVNDVISLSESTVAINRQPQSTRHLKAHSQCVDLSHADHELMGLKQMLDVKRNDLVKSFRDQVAAFNFAGISERVEELEAQSFVGAE